MVHTAESYMSVINQCELQSLRVGSELSDAFNSFAMDESNDRRMNSSPYLAEHLGFAPSLFSDESAALQAKHQWINTKDIDKSPYKSLNHQWIYMIGDSTTRQVWASFGAPFQHNRDFERNSKEWTRHYCNSQGPYRPVHHHHGKEGNFTEEEGWAGPCGKNEVTCHISGYGERGVLSFDWKHFPYEDYDTHLWEKDGVWQSGFPGEGDRRPDVVTIQTGMHLCHHAFESSPVNLTFVESHLRNIPKLFQHVREAVDLSNKVSSNNNSTRLVIAVTSGATYNNYATSLEDNCVLRVNRVVEREARRRGFAVLARGEIERRLMQASLFEEQPTLTPQMHLPLPAQSIVATSLLSLIDCLYNQSVHMGQLSPSVLSAIEKKVKLTRTFSLPQQQQQQGGEREEEHNHNHSQDKHLFSPPG